MALEVEIFHLISEHTNKDIKFGIVNRSCQSSQVKRVTDTVMRMVDRSDPYSLNFLVADRMKSKRRRSKPYPKAVLDMVDDVQPGAHEPEDFAMIDDDFDFELDQPDEDTHHDDEFDEDYDDLEDSTPMNDPDLNSVQLLEELDGIPDDEKGLGDDLADYLSTGKLEISLVSRLKICNFF